MRSIGMRALVVAGFAGSAMGAGEPVALEASRGAVRHVGHIYFNIATGEKITTLMNAGDVQVAAVGNVGSEVWVADTGAQCADFGFTTEFFFGLDDPTGTTALSLNAICFDWGDIRSDTVVDCVQIHWVTDHVDTDTDSDGIADGVEGFAGTWIYWDGMNGRGPQLNCISVPLIAFTFFSLQGQFPVDTAVLSFWTADIDLGGSFGNSMIFELADTDGNLQGAAIASQIAFPVQLDLDSDSIPDWDPDDDGLADWGWSIQFNQPGTIDVDNADGDSDSQTGIDGDPALLNTAGIVFGSPTPGHAEYDSLNEVWNWISDANPPYVTEDAFALGTTGNPNGSGVLTIAGTFFFGGLSCDADPTTGQYNPAAHFQTVLYAGGPCGNNGTGGPCNPADIAGLPNGCPDAALTFSDISAYLQRYSAEDPRADIAGNTDGSPDGLFTFTDISAFIAMYSLGCP